MLGANIDLLLYGDVPVNFIIERMSYLEHLPRSSFQRIQRLGLGCKGAECSASAHLDGKQRTPLLFSPLFNTHDPLRVKTANLVFSFSEDSDQTGPTLRIWPFFIVRIKKAYVLIAAYYAQSEDSDQNRQGLPETSICAYATLLVLLRCGSFVIDGML